jgi:hypothetical protein
MQPEPKVSSFFSPTHQLLRTTEHGNQSPSLDDTITSRAGFLTLFPFQLRVTVLPNIREVNT